MKKNIFLLVSLFILLVPVALWASQEAQPSPRIEITGVNATGLPTVTITTNVFDTLGQPITGLAAENFVLTGELAERATIVSVENISDENLAFATVLVIDVSSSMAEQPLAQAKEAAKTFISAIGPNDPVAIVSFSTDAFVVQDYTTDKDLLISAINTLAYGGQTALYDAAGLGVEKAAEAPFPRRAVILLSDGAEYGGASASAREDALNEARIRGVPVYTIGLGYGIDRSYLRGLSAGTNARNYESPTPDELIEIYRNLANLLRSQYVITLNVDVPTDGTVYNFSLQATTPEGDTDTTTATVRAPIPVPIVSLDGFDVEPISEVTELTAEVAADDEITDSQFTLDGNVIESDGFTITIDPVVLLPGEHPLELTVTDASGDTVTGTANIQIAALPSEVTVSGLPEGEISTPSNITLATSGQTAAASATYSIDGGEATTSDSAPFEFTLDPFQLPPGEHNLTIEVLNQGGVTTSVSQDFTVAALAPIVLVQGVESGQSLSVPAEISVEAVGQTPITSIVVALDGTEVSRTEAATSATYSIDPMQIAPGGHNLTVTTTDTSGQATTNDLDFIVAALPPIVTLNGLLPGDVLEVNQSLSLEVTSQTDVSGVTYSIDGVEVQSTNEAPYTFDLDVLSVAPGEHTLSATVTNEGGQATTLDVPFTVSEGPSLTGTASVPTSTLTPTNTPEATNTPLPTNTALPSNTPRPSSTPQPTDTDEPTATIEPTDEPTLVAQVNPTDEPTNTPRPTNTTIPTDEPTEVPSDTPTPTDEPTNTPRPTNTTIPTDEPTEVPSDTSTPTDEPTNTPRPTNTARPSSTPQPTATTQPTDEPTLVVQVASQEATEDATQETIGQAPTDETPDPTATFSPLSTPVELTEIVSQSAPEDTASNTPFIIILIIIVLIILLALYLFTRRNRRV